MPDFNIDVGFNTKSFEKLFSKQTGGAGPQAGIKTGPQAGGSAFTLGKGIATALKATGIVSLLMNLKVIVDLLASILAVLNLGVILFLKKMYEFFQDPAKGLLSFGLFLLNGIVAALEKFANAIPGVDVKFGRFREDIVGEELDAGASLVSALSQGFLTEEAYQKEKIVRSLLAFKAQEDAYLEQLRADDLRASLARQQAEEVNASLIPAVAAGNTAFLTFWSNFIDKIDGMNRKVTGSGLSTAGLEFEQSRITGPLSPSQALGAASLQSTSTTDKDARLINYLTGLNR